MQDAALEKLRKNLCPMFVRAKHQVATPFGGGHSSPGGSGMSVHIITPAPHVPLQLLLVLQGIVTGEFAQVVGPGPGGIGPPIPISGIISPKSTKSGLIRFNMSHEERDRKSTRLNSSH